MRTLCASTLIGEFLVIGFAALVATRLGGLPAGTVWAVAGTAMLLCPLLCGMLGRPGALQLGWALQIALIASGFAVPAMFFLGAVFAGLWWASIHFGRMIDEAKARRAAGAGAGAV
ncbi:DUF4233 domain-containing protein [Streptomyces sp. CNQ085]|uniref:DUF4233 domain-containing protein n=1 Tax=Streptomyces sp. CNQ085 TaxID=2886944 RepID=UPI001F50C78B|nr:DUF4233 domain-containing protein [Streptomyces sp. CNQ085]MCI0383257.1 DUF4233 domain-containing protein [Streptomyces sp. CNQ085]